MNYSRLDNIERTDHVFGKEANKSLKDALSLWVADNFLEQ